MLVTKCIQAIIEKYCFQCANIMEYISLTVSSSYNLLNLEHHIMEYVPEISGGPQPLCQAFRCFSDIESTAIIELHNFYTTMSGVKSSECCW